MNNIYRDFGNSITKFGFKLITIKAISQESKFQSLIRISQTAVIINSQCLAKWKVQDFFRVLLRIVASRKLTLYIFLHRQSNL